MLRNIRLISRLPDRHHHIRHLGEHTNTTCREAKRHRGRSLVQIAILRTGCRRVQQETLAAGPAVVDQDVRVEPVHEDGLVGLRFRERGLGLGVAEGPTYEWGGVDEGFSAVVHGGVGGEEGIADEARLLFRDEDGVSEVEESVESRRSGGGFGGSPGAGEVERGGVFGIEEGLQPGEEGEGEIGR